MIVSPSMSLVAAGFASGICLLLISNILRGKSGEEKKEGKEIPVDDNQCACCLKPFLVGRGVRCSDCGARSCRKGCSRWDTTDNAWHCLFCHQQRYWLKRNGKLFENFEGPIQEKDLHRYFNTAKSRVYVAGVENAAASTDLAVAGGKEEANAMETVREFIEKIVEGLIGNVNDASIERLYDHPTYDNLLEKYIVPLADALTRLAVALRLSLANKPNTDSPTMAHTALREIVERAVEEARKLPGLGTSGDAGRPQEGKNILENSYEDLLATAILNKVIEKFQREQVDGNSNVLHGKPVPASNCTLNETEMGLDEGVEEGCSSLEPLSQDDCSDCGASCSRRVRNKPEPLSLTIEERIEEVTTTYTSDEEPRDNDVLAIRNTHRVPFPELGMDIIDPSQDSEDSQDEPDTPTTHVDLVSPIESWEENWLFQKKKVQTQADPVAMLVPNPSADYKALIGDKDAEDTSDLSECSSAQSDEEIEKELMEAISKVVPRSPRKKNFENGFDRSSNNFPSKKTCDSKVHTTESTINDWKLTGFDETEIRIECIDEKENGDFDKNGGEIVEEGIIEIREDIQAKDVEKLNVYNSTKEMEENMNIINGGEESEESISESRGKSSISELKEGSREEDSKNEESKETVDGVEIVSQPTDQIDFVIKLNSTDSMPGGLSEESESTVPKTPTSTPTRTSAMGVNVDSSNQDMFSQREENVLNSLECAKKKLMAVDEDIIDGLDDSETKSCDLKVDFHAEDIQQESEYTEHYDTATQRHLDSLVKTDCSVVESEGTDSNLESEAAVLNDDSSDKGERKCREAAASAKPVSATPVNEKTEEEVQLATPPRPGTIAEREHKKWENAPPIENNPYSQENIQRRLWERQYARRSSDKPGMHTELPKTNGADLDVVLTRPEPDIKRFGRDYYINGSIASSTDKGRRSAASTSSRPGSSLSQRSNSTGTDQDQQEEIRYKDTEALLNKSNDVKSKVAKWQNNHAETKYQSPIRGNSTDSIRSYEPEKPEEYTKNGDCPRKWDDRRMEELLENERKNSKNEINAKLNNQDNSVMETRKSDDRQRKIKRIDLKAYGFENEFSSNKVIRTSTPRVVNKLDLKSFGYDQGIRRTQSNIHLNSIDNDFKPRMIKVANKSNLTLRSQRDTIETQGSGDNFTQSTEALNKLNDQGCNGFGLKSAKSVPNIAKFYSDTSDNREDEEVESYNENSYDELGVIKNGSVRNIAINYDNEKYHLKSSESSIYDESEISDISSERGQNNQSMSNGERQVLREEEFDNKVLPMPSVRRLAQAFSKQREATSTPASKTIKPSSKERSSTPEIQIVETPRQMHSLTARSLSKQFREGLRQIPNKMTSPPASYALIEQPKILETPTEVVQSKTDNATDDKDVILPGKLKSNIIFWEQMQKQN